MGFRGLRLYNAIRNGEMKINKPEGLVRPIFLT
jgi:hypothetical protein